jgi:peptide/nickel transport system permease protein
MKKTANAEAGSKYHFQLHSTIPQLNNLKKSLKPRIRETKHSIILLKKSPLTVIGLCIVAIITLIAIFAPILAPPYLSEQFKDPYTIPRDFEKFVAIGGPSPPGYDGFILGSGDYGADIYYGIIWGARVSILIALVIVLTSALVGALLGAIAGYYGGYIDDALMRITDVFMSLPSLVLAMAVAAALSATIENIMLALIIVWWPSYARLIRGQVLTIKENTYIEAAKAAGAKKSRILFRHIIPNSLSPLLVSATMDMGTIVLTTAGLSYIGFGPPNITEWGRMISDGQQLFSGTIFYNGVEMIPYWVVIFPGIMIFLFVMGFNLLGDGIRDIMDPRLRR